MDEKIMQKAEVLIEALPYIQRFNRKIIVVKYGGSAMVDDELKKNVIKDVVLLKLVGFKPIIVHGGGKEISSWVKRLGMEPKFVNGLRVTDAPTMELAEMVLNRVNKGLVQMIQELGVKAVGIDVYKRQVVGQSIGAQRYKEAKGYVFRLMAIAHSAIAVLNVFIMVFCRQIVSFYSLSPEAAEMAWQVAMLHSICCIVFWPPSFTMPNALRAANDARFTMVISIASMFLFRIVLSYVLGRYLGLGLLGVWAAMVCDWIVR